jgi:hypothetical protein
MKNFSPIFRESQRMVSLVSQLNVPKPSFFDPSYRYINAPPPALRVPNPEERMGVTWTATGFIPSDAQLLT